MWTGGCGGGTRSCRIVHLYVCMCVCVCVCVLRREVKSCEGFLSSHLRTCDCMFMCMCVAVALPVTVSVAKSA